MFNFFKKKSRLKEMAGVEEKPSHPLDKYDMPWPQPPPPPSMFPTRGRIKMTIIDKDGNVTIKEIK